MMLDDVGINYSPSLQLDLVLQDRCLRLERTSHDRVVAKEPGEAVPPQWGVSVMWIDGKPSTLVCRVGENDGRELSVEWEES